MKEETAVSLVYWALRLVVLAFLICALVFTAGGRNLLKHFHSSVTGLDRQIVLYDGNGRVLRSWHTRSRLEDKGGTCYFLVDGKAVTVSGTFVVEEQ